MDELQKRLITIIESEKWLIGILKEARGLNLPDWYIGAGAIRNTVWNHLHGKSGIPPMGDIDLIYYDYLDIEGKKEKKAEKILSKKLPEFKWEVVNQAIAHRFNKGRTKATSSCNALSYWIETPTCIGVRLEKDNSFTLCAPHGLEDLFNLVVRPTSLDEQNLKIFIKRMKEKNWIKKWPNLKIYKPSSQKCPSAC